MPPYAKKFAKSAPSELKDVTKKAKKQSLKKTQKTAEIKAAKKLAKSKVVKAVSDKVRIFRVMTIFSYLSSELMMDLHLFS